MARPAETQRERAVALLRRAYADGRLELEEFEARAAKALAAPTTAHLNLQLRGLLVDEARRSVRRGARVAATVVVWLFLSFFLAVGCVVVLFSTRASPWTLAFPAVWLAITALAMRDVRRTR